MKISIIIVNYNGEHYLDSCLNSIKQSQTNIDFEVIIIDNNSTDNSIDCLNRYKSDYKIILNHNNSGFSKANNIAVTYATGDYYFFLNNDTVLFPDTLDLLVRLVDEHKSVIVPKLLNDDGTLQRPGGLLGQWRFKSTQPTTIPFAAGAAILISKEAYETCGGFDNHYFFYNEDVDLCKSLKKHGYKIYYDPRVSLIHSGGVATTFRKAHSIIEGYRGGFYLCKKHYGTIALQCYRLLVLCDIIPRLIVQLLLTLFNRQHSQAVGAYLSVLKLNLKQDFMFIHPKENVTVLS